VTAHGPQRSEIAVFEPFLQAKKASDYPVITEYGPEAEELCIFEPKTGVIFFGFFRHSCPV